jgi:glycolate oxidase FAD binding subunit
MLDEQTRKRLIEIVGRANLKDDETIGGFTIDGLGPRAVLFPGTAEMVEEIVMVAAEQGLSLIPWGGGTQIDMGSPPRKMDLVICMKYLNRIVDQDHENMSVTAEAGISLGALQESLSTVGPGFFLPLDPPRAEEVTLGGAVAVNASGPGRLRYGTMRDLVLGIKALIPEEAERQDAVIAGGKTVKNVSGYDMSKLYIGSLGSLAIILEITCRILPLPEDRATMVAGFAGSEAPWAYSQSVLDSQLVPSAIEVYNHGVASLLSAHVPTSQERSMWAAITFEGVSRAIAREIKDIERFAKSERAHTIAILRGSGEGAFWKALGEVGWEIRRSNAWSIALKVSVPPFPAPSVIEKMTEGAQRAGVSLYHLSHAGNGITYTYVPLDEDRYRDKEEALIRMTKHLREQAEDMGGSLVVEYAPPLFKERFNVWGNVGSAFSIMKRLKEAFDPGSILNPGRFAGGI